MMDGVLAIARIELLRLLRSRATFTLASPVDAAFGLPLSVQGVARLGAPGRKRLPADAFHPCRSPRSVAGRGATQVLAHGMPIVAFLALTVAITLLARSTEPD